MTDRRIAFGMLVLILFSAAASQVVAAPFDTIKNFLARPVSAATPTIALSWTASPTPTVTGVRIMRRSGATCPTDPNDPLAVKVFDGTGTTFADAGVTGATQYCYVAYAHDSRPVYASGISTTVVTPSLLTVRVAATPSSGSAPLNTTLSAAVSGGSPPYASYHWVLDDNSTVDTATVARSYGSSGNYTSTVTVTDSKGNTETGQVTVSVSAPAPLTVTASADKTMGTKPLTVNFTGTASGGVLPYSAITWVFGDGQSSSDLVTSHQFTTAGTFTPQLTVKDKDNITVTKSVPSLTVSEPPSGTMTATLAAAPTAGSAPLPVSFTATGSGGTGPYTYDWNFGDGGATIANSTASQTHSYAVAGSYTAAVTAKDSAGHTAAAQQTISVAATAPAGKPAPQNLKVLGVSGKQGLLTWENSTAEADPQYVSTCISWRYSAPWITMDSPPNVPGEGSGQCLNQMYIPMPYYVSAPTPPRPDSPVYVRVYNVYRLADGSQIYSDMTQANFSLSPAPISFSNGLVTSIKKNSLSVHWETNVLTTSKINIWQVPRTYAPIAQVAADTSAPVVDHNLLVTATLAPNTMYEYEITSGDSVSTITPPPVTITGKFMSSYADAAGNFWYGVDLGGSAGFIATDQTNSWNGSKTPLDPAKCDNSCNQYYTCSAMGIPNCLDDRNASINASNVCGAVAIADCTDGTKHLASGGTGSLPASALQSWPQSRLADVSELSAVCGPGLLKDYPSALGYFSKNPADGDNQSVKLFGRFTCTEFVAPVSQYWPNRVVAPAGTWTP